MILKVEGLHVSYGKIAAVRDVSIEVGQGEIVALIGPNGAGKSTLLKTVAGLLRCGRGSIQFDGRPIANRPAAEVKRRGLALVLEGRSTLRQMTVHENLILGGYVRSDHGAIAAVSTGCSTGFPSCANVSISAPERYPAANSRCW
jgi:branched-chain amino acid transport system ATP-binding protein